MNGIQLFQNNVFGEMRVAEHNGEPIFCLADVCSILELQTSRVKNRLDDDLTLSNPIVDNLGREQLATFVTEAGLYDVILRSDKATAREFRKWVTSDVLPSIRKNGGYMVSRTDDTDDEIMARALLVAQATINKRNERIEALEKANADKQMLIDSQTQTITEMQPKQAFADAILGSKGSILIGQLAKLLSQNGVNIGQNRLFQFMREKGYLMKFGERYNMPTQRYIDMGLFELKANTYSKDGEMYTTYTPKVTAKDQQYFIDLFTNKTK